MAITSTNRRNDYVGSNDNSDYSYTFRIYDSADVLVIIRNISTGVETILVEGDDYNVSFVGEVDGGQIQLIDNGQAWIDGSGFLDSAYALSIRLYPVLEQATDIKNNAKYFPSLHELQFDKQFQISLRHQDEIDRSVKTISSISTAEFDPTLPAEILSSANKFLVINSTGDGFSLATGTTADLAPIEEFCNLSGLTSGRGVYYDGTSLQSLDVTNTELNYLDGATSNIQDQLDAIDLSGVVTTTTINNASLPMSPQSLLIPTNTTFYTNNANAYHFTLLNSTFTANRSILMSDRSSFIPGNPAGGNFTPTLELTSGSVTYSASTYARGLTSFVTGAVNGGTGLYVLNIRIELSAISSPVNTALKISGIPFKRWDSYPVYTIIPVYVENCTVTGQVFGRISHNGTTNEYTIELVAVNNGAATAISAATFLQSNSVLILSTQYFVEDLA